MAEGIRFIPSGGEIKALLTGSDGPVYKDLVKRAIKVTAAAKRYCPVDKGRLRSSMRYEMSPGPIARVGTDVNYAAAVHNGTRAHDIFPKNASVLAFKIGGQTVFAASVHHPGTKGVKFLTMALASIREA